MAVYERATQAVENEERHQMFNIYIKRAAEIYGVTYTRAIYQKAIEVHPAVVTTHQLSLNTSNARLQVRIFYLLVDTNYRYFIMPLYLAIVGKIFHFNINKRFILNVACNTSDFS